MKLLAAAFGAVLGVALSMMHRPAAALPPEPATVDHLVTVKILSKYNPTGVRLFSGSKMGLTVQLGSEQLQAHACGVSLVGERLGVRCGATETEQHRAITVTDLGGHVGVQIGDKVKRRYRGKIIIETGPTELVIKNQLPLEQYLYSVVASEMPFREPEALKAQAVLARTFALRHRSRNGTYDFSDMTTDQVYTGVDGETLHSIEAVKQTQGQVAVYDGKLIEVYYHSTSGGHTTSPDLVWGGGGEVPPYLQGVLDEYGSASPHYRWTNMLTHEEVRRLEIEGLKGTIIGIKVMKRTPHGRVSEVEIQMSTGCITMTGYEFYRLVGETLGWHLVKSDWFSVLNERGRIMIQGRGLGHGVGMNQWGAQEMAQKNFKYPEIIAYYMPGVEVRQWDVRTMSVSR